MFRKTLGLVILLLFFLPTYVKGQQSWNYEVFFESGKWVKKESKLSGFLNDLNCLQHKQIVKIELNSFTDSVGNFIENQKLSQQRLDYIFNQLKKTIDVSNIKIIKTSNGETSANDESLALNRNVTIQIHTQDIQTKAGMGLMNTKYNLYVQQKDSTACNQFIKIVDRITKAEYEAFPYQPKTSTVYTIKSLVNEIDYACHGHVFFFKNGNYNLQDSIGWFDQSVKIDRFCGGIKVDSLDFSRNHFSVRFDKSDNGFYVYLPSCPQRPVCCGTYSNCEQAVLLPNVFKENQVILTYLDTINEFDSTLKRNIKRPIKKSVVQSEKLAYQISCYTDSIKIFAKWDECFWQTMGSFQYYLNRTNEKLLDSLKQINQYSIILKHTTVGQQVFVAVDDFKAVYFTDRKIVIKNKDAIEAGIFLPEFHVFIPYKKKWFNRFVGYEIEDLQYVVMIKRGEKLFSKEDYKVKIKHRANKSIFRFIRPN